MSIRKPVVDASAAELARRRLTLLGAELATAPQATPAPETTPVPEDDSHAVGLTAVPVGRRAADLAGGAPDEVSVVRPGAGRHAGARLSWGSRVLARFADSLPGALHGRLRITAQHVTVVALTLAAAMAVAAWLLVRSAPEQLPRRASWALPPGQSAAMGSAQRFGVVPTGDGLSRSAVPAAAPAAVGPAPGAAATASPGRLVVHVAGRVRRPGVVELPAGSRVIDAIEAAGGARPGARLGALNLARLVVDGEQIAVGVPAAASAPAAAGATLSATPSLPGTVASLVNLNTASQADLEELPGVGPVTATSIIEWRTQHGGFSSVDELIEVSGIGDVTLAELRDLVTV
ncbi:MAG TPA: ComEA family DNA-binding protein [Nocardioidaceae bacterium]|nr:ComEA family DNA-binding protein [Nocardioidaceae bacterium]